MTIDAKGASANIHGVAIEKLRRLQQSPRYRSFYSLEAIDAFAKVEPSALAGGALPHHNCRETLDN